jgi:adenylate cyclase
MPQARTERRLAAILAADVVGYSRLMATDEAGTHARLKMLWKKFIEERIADHHGRIVKLMGDGALVDFASAVDAVECAMAIQSDVIGRQKELSEDQRIVFRIGINIGDIIIENKDIYGGGVNVAARLETLAEPGGVCIARNVYNQVKDKVALGFEPMGAHRVKNIPEPVVVYRVVHDPRPGAKPGVSNRTFATSRRFAALAAIAFVLLGAIAVVAWQQPWTGKNQASRPENQSTVAVNQAIRIPKGPSIAVVPFENLSGDKNQEFFSDGITDEIITGLSRFRDILVVSFNSTYRYKNKPVDVRQVGGELGVQYVLEGSVRRGGDRLRVTAQLLDAKTGMHVWSESYDHDLKVENVLDVQDDVREQVVAHIANPGGGVVSLRGIERAKRQGPDTLKAYDCVLLAHAYLLAYTAEAHRRARDCLESALEVDPRYADAWAWLAHMYDDEYVNDLNTRPDALVRAEAAARQAIELDPMNQKGHWELAVNSFFQHQDEEFKIEAERALDLNPNNAAAVGDLGIFMVGIGEWERGFKMAQKATALDPFGTVYYFPIFRYYYHSGEYEKALAAAEKIDLVAPRKWQAMAAAYGQLGRKEEAEAAAAKLIELDPAFRERAREKIGKIVHSEEFVEHMIEGLRKAGLAIPERST